MAAVVSCFLRSRSQTGHRIIPACFHYLNSGAFTDVRLGSPTIAPSNQWSVAVRGFSDDLRIVTSTLSEADYHHAADKTLDTMVEKLEVYVEDKGIQDGDVEYSQGVLTVKLGRHGVFVINKQTPNRQIWLSSPVSGPFRFDYANGRWIYNRDGRDLVWQLEQEIGALVGSELRLE